MLSVVKVLVDHGLDVDARDQVAGRTAIHLAVERQLEDMVLFLVKEANFRMIFCYGFPSSILFLKDFFYPKPGQTHGHSTLNI